MLESLRFFVSKLFRHNSAPWRLLGTRSGRSSTYISMNLLKLLNPIKDLETLGEMLCWLRNKGVKSTKKQYNLEMCSRASLSLHELWVELILMDLENLVVWSTRKPKHKKWDIGFWSQLDTIKSVRHDERCSLSFRSLGAVQTLQNLQVHWQLFSCKVLKCKKTHVITIR